MRGPRVAAGDEISEGRPYTTAERLFLPLGLITRGEDAGGDVGLASQGWGWTRRNLPLVPITVPLSTIHHRLIRKGVIV